MRERASGRGRLAGKVAVVTGASGGIGRAIMRAFAAEGASLVLSGSRTRIEDAPPSSIYLPGDLRDEGYAASLITTAVDAHGRIDVLVNGHGIDHHADVREVSLVEADDVLRVNVLAVLAMMKHAIPAMIAGGGGSIVNLASRLGQVAIPGQAMYSASKGALIMLSRGVAIDFAASGVRVNCVAPGITATGMIESWIAAQPDPATFVAQLKASIPLGRLASPAEIAAAVLFLASDESSYVTGAVLSVDGGYTAA